jgi:hypothetical protein
MKQPPRNMMALERHYRRLLRCYPPSHRAAHREEMLGVLLEVARPGQRRPDAWQAVLVAIALLFDLGPFTTSLTDNLLFLSGSVLVAAIAGPAVATRAVAPAAAGRRRGRTGPA